MKPSPRSVLDRFRKGGSGIAPEFPRLTHRIMASDGVPIDLTVRSESDWWVYNEVFVDHEYDGPLQAALDSATRSGRFLVVDLGANAGYFSARAVERWHRSALGGSMTIVMVEGSPSVSSDLRARHAEHPLPGVDVKLLHALVGDRYGTAEIAETHFGARNTLHAEHNAGITPVEQMVRHEVAFVDLDVVVPDGKIDLLKIDIEGSELRVLETYYDTLLRRVSVAVLEFHHELVDVDRCYELLSLAGLEPTTPRDLEETYTSVAMFTRRAAWGV